jgi:hypothetical protein
MGYSITQKAMACDLVRRNGGILDAATMRDIRAMLGNAKLPDQTVRNWVKTFLGDQKKQVADSPTETASALEIVQSKASQKIEDELDKLAQKLIAHAQKDEVIAKANIQQAMTALGITIDKARLIRGLPTEIVSLTIELVDLMRRKGHDPMNMLGVLRSHLESMPDAVLDAPMVTPSHGAN